MHEKNKHKVSSAKFLELIITDHQYKLWPACYSIDLDGNSWISLDSTVFLFGAEISTI